MQRCSQAQLKKWHWYKKRKAGRLIVCLFLRVEEPLWKRTKHISSKPLFLCMCLFTAFLSFSPHHQHNTSQVSHLCGEGDYSSSCIRSINRQWYRKVLAKPLKETTALCVVEQLFAVQFVQLKLTGEKLVPLPALRTDTRTWWFHCRWF